MVRGEQLYELVLAAGAVVQPYFLYPAIHKGEENCSEIVPYNGKRNKKGKGFKDAEQNISSAGFLP